MKKIISLALCIALMASFAVIATTNASAETVLTVGSSGAYLTLAEAIDAAADGDTIQLVSNTTESWATKEDGSTGLSLNKSITIDTNGFIWYGGNSTGSDNGNTCLKKPSLLTISGAANVTITNSKRTGSIGVTDEFDINGAGPKLGGLFTVANTSSLNLQNIIICNSNSNTNNCSAIVMNTTSNKIIVNNSYLYSTSESVVNNSAGYALNLTVTNSILQNGTNYNDLTTKTGNDRGSIVFCRGASKTAISTITIENSTIGTIGSRVADNSTTALDDTTNSCGNVTVTLKNTSGNRIFGKDLNVVFAGGCSFNSVYDTINVSAAEGTALYSDSTYSTPVIAGVLAESTPIYSFAAPVDETPTQTVEVGGTTKSVKTQMVKGGAMRYFTEATPALDGIRFLAKFNTADIDAIKAEGYEITAYGTEISYENSVKKAYAVGNGFFDYKYAEEGYSYVAGSVIGIKSDHITGKFSAISYLEFTKGDEVVKLYSIANDNERSIAYIAYCVKNGSEYDGLTEAQKAQVDAYADKYVA